jgi:hypothetical protein
VGAGNPETFRDVPEEFLTDCESLLEVVVGDPRGDPIGDLNECRLSLKDMQPRFQHDQPGGG